MNFYYLVLSRCTYKRQTKYVCQHDDSLISTLCTVSDSGKNEKDHYTSILPDD